MKQKYFRFQSLMKLVVLAHAESHVIVLLQLSISIGVMLYIFRACAGTIIMRFCVLLFHMFLLSVTC